MSDQHDTSGKICPKCNAVSHYSDDFCVECGARLPSETVCPSCGEKIPPGEKFCSSCGASVAPSPGVVPQIVQPAVEYPPEAAIPAQGNGPKKYLVPAIIAVVIIAVIAAVVIGGTPAQMKSNGVQSSTATPTTIPQTAASTSPTATYSATTTFTTQATTAPASTIRAGFTVDKASGSIPLTVSFTDTSTGSPSQWYWDFGDGTHSTENNPVHTFKAEGSFTVTLNVDKNGQTSSKSQVITASSVPLVADFVADKTSGTAPLLVTFTDASTGEPTTWVWEIPEIGAAGHIFSQSNILRMNFNDPGTFTVQLTVGKDGVKSKTTKTINVYPTSSTTTLVTTTVPITTTSVATSEFNNGNVYTVYNSPTKPTVVTFTVPVKIISITDYHWNNGMGASPGQIALKHSDGTLYGWWSASGQPGSGGVPNAYWTVNPSVNIKAGTYTVLDSDSSTWAQNSQSGNAGMTRIIYQPV